MNETLHWADLQDAGNAQAQLVLFAIARHADWKTGECWPSQEALAEMSKCSDRTVRSYLKQLEENGFIVRETRLRSDGGRGSDLIRLNGYADWVNTLRGGGQVSAPKRADTPPENLSGTPGKLPSDPPGKQASCRPGKQSSALEGELSLEQSNELRARERASDKDARAPVAQKPAAAVTVRAGESSFSAWIEHFKRLGRDDLASDARDAGEITVTQRWPSGEVMPLRIPQAQGLRDISKRIIGDAAL